METAPPNRELNRSKIVGKRIREETLAWASTASSGVQTSLAWPFAAWVFFSG